MKEFNFKKFVEKQIKKQFMSMIPDANIPEVHFIDNSYTVQYFKVKYYHKNEVKEISGSLSLETGFIKFK